MARATKRQNGEAKNKRRLKRMKEACTRVRYPQVERADSHRWSVASDISSKDECGRARARRGGWVGGWQSALRESGARLLPLADAHVQLRARPGAVRFARPDEGDMCPAGIGAQTCVQTCARRRMWTRARTRMEYAGSLSLLILFVVTQRDATATWTAPAKPETSDFRSSTVKGATGLAPEALLLGLLSFPPPPCDFGLLPH